MHVIVPFAAPLSDAGREALKHLQWPALAQQLAAAEIEAPEGDDEWSLNTPAEQALARALEWDVADGLVPMARWQAQADGVAAADMPMALVTPVHWGLGAERVRMADPAELALDEAASRAFFELLQPLFASEGFGLVHGAPGRWYLQHESLATLPTASLQRAIGRHVDPWLDSRENGLAPDRQRQARLVRRLQNEAQMLLHEHALNEEREGRGLATVNSLWISGSGPALALPRTLPQLDSSLVGAALAEDWRGWYVGWQLLDARLATLPWTQLTLCGERRSRTVLRGGSGWAARLRAKMLGWRRVDVRVLLESL